MLYSRLLSRLRGNASRWKAVWKWVRNKCPWALEKSLFREFNRTRQLLHIYCADSPGTFSNEESSSARCRFVKAPWSTHGCLGRSAGSMFRSAGPDWSSFSTLGLILPFLCTFLPPISEIWIVTVAYKLWGSGKKWQRILHFSERI